MGQDKRMNESIGNKMDNPDGPREDGLLPLGLNWEQSCKVSPTSLRRPVNKLFTHAFVLAGSGR